MEDISSILAKFNIQSITEQYYIALQQKRDGVLLKKERQLLEGKIREYAPDKSSGHRTQQIDIFYNFVDEIELSHEIAQKETA